MSKSSYEIGDWVIARWLIFHTVCRERGSKYSVSQHFADGWRCISCGNYVPQEALDVSLLQGWCLDAPISYTWDEWQDEMRKVNGFKKPTSVFEDLDALRKISPR